MKQYTKPVMRVRSMAPIVMCPVSGYDPHPHHPQPGPWPPPPPPPPFFHFSKEESSIDFDEDYE